MKNILSDLVIEKIISANNIYSETGANAKRINREYWSITLKYEGETQYKNKGRLFKSDKFNIMLLPKGSSYEWLCTEAGHFAAIEFQSPQTNEEIFSFQVNSSDEILKLFKKIEYDRLSKKPTYAMENIRDTYSVLLKLSASQKEYFTSEKAERLRPAIEYILKNYTSHIRSEELAALTGMSHVYFRKMFKEVYGASPIDYVKKIRMKKAKEMLHSDFSSITDISFSLGYPSIYDFSRDFKKQVGISPLKYAKSK